jgi:hypothetical protein
MVSDDDKRGGGGTEYPQSAKWMQENEQQKGKYKREGEFKKEGLTATLNMTKHSKMSMRKIKKQNKTIC